MVLFSMRFWYEPQLSSCSFYFISLYTELHCQYLAQLYIRYTHISWVQLLNLWVYDVRILERDHFYDPSSFVKFSWNKFSMYVCVVSQIMNFINEVCVHVWSLQRKRPWPSNLDKVDIHGCRHTLLEVWMHSPELKTRKYWWNGKNNFGSLDRS